MPTKKTTTTKKTPAKKTVKKVAEPVVEEPKEEVVYEVQSEIDTKEAMKKEPMVRMIIPIDPYDKSEHQTFEFNINGVQFCYPRGEEIELPKSLADTYVHCLRQNQIIAQVYAPYTNGNGVRLNF